MNGAVFVIWFEAARTVGEDRHLGEFSSADHAARQQPQARGGLVLRLAARLGQLAHRARPLPAAAARA